MSEVHVAASQDALLAMGQVAGPPEDARGSRWGAMHDLTTSPLEQEALRLGALKRYDILDTPPDGCFDRVTAVAAKLFSAPIAIVSLVDEDRIWFKSHHGLDVQQIDREPGLCASAILQDHPYIVEDAKRDVRTLANPLVAGEFGLRFYAAAPLRTRDGYKLGTLCVIDRDPRAVLPEQVEQLEQLAGIVMDEMELRLEARRAVADVRKVTQRMTEESRQREEEARKISGLLTAIGASSPNPIYAKDLDLRFIYANDAMVAILGHPIERVLGARIEDVIQLRGQAVAYRQANHRVLETGLVHHVEEVFTTPDGTDVIFQSSMAPLRSSADEVIGLVGVSVDVTDRKRADEHQRLLINELNHRVKNTLAIVQSLAQQSFKGKASPQEERKAFEARICTLAAAHNLLTQETWTSVRLDQIIAATAGAACGAHASRLTCDGPKVELAPQTAVSIAMTVHELCTNAIKYGALSNEDGSIRTSWETYDQGEEPRLRLEWVELGGPPVETPQKTGFGTRLIERGLASELGGSVRLKFNKEGLVCLIDAPLPAKSDGDLRIGLNGQVPHASFIPLGSG